jgi:hypothetical protein
MKRNLILQALVILILTSCPFGTPADPSGLPSAAPAKGARSPLRIVVLYDKTDSRAENLIEDLRPEHLHALCAKLIERGGELALGIIDDASNQKLARISFDLPLPRPHLTGNPFADRKKLREYNLELERREAELARWQQIAWARVQHFITSVEPLLSTDTLAPVTDIAGGIRRARLFLQERHPYVPEMEKYLLLITDGEETRQLGQTVRIEKDIHVLVANGQGVIGILDSLRPVPFESIEAAVRWIGTQEE